MADTRTARCWHCRRETTQIKVQVRKRDGQRGVKMEDHWKCATCGTLVEKT